MQDNGKVLIAASALLVFSVGFFAGRWSSGYAPASEPRTTPNKVLTSKRPMKTIATPIAPASTSGPDAGLPLKPPPTAEPADAEKTDAEPDDAEKDAVPKRARVARKMGLIRRSPGADSDPSPDELLREAARQRAKTSNGRQRAKALISAAQKAYMAGEYGRAIDLARRAVVLAPNNQVAWQVMGVAACYRKDRGLVKRADRELGVRRRNLLRTVCIRNGVLLR